ncbi:ribokinase [Massilia arenosa]|uniref:Ribokinase n=1 Tax=Zemynaea arenosa TaxID=2561931 RepID=A0A4Y9S7V6_9BURK|nr:ribokinase [Massilia arenosa]TFW16571.1 ribokinase [Massilia arenosa]
MSAPITVVGSINIDLVFCTPRMPAVGETITGNGFHQVQGGKGANQAVAAARLGGEVRFVGAVGRDDFGTSALVSMRAEGIDTGAVATVDRPSGVAGIFVAEGGANSIVIAPGANDAVSPEHVECAAPVITSASYLVCQLETPLASVTRAVALAHAAGVRVVLNAAPAQPLDDALLAQIDYLIVNETEAAQMSGIAVTDAPSALAAAQALRARGAGTVLVTMGAAGVQVCGASVQQFLPAFQVKVVDTTAAGDTFVGAFTVALATGYALAEAADFAQAAAAIAVTRMGAQTSIPARDEVLDVLNQRGKAA